MFNFEHTISGKFDLDTVWQYYSDPSLWKEWDHSISSAEISGPFKTGAKGAMIYHNSPPCTFVLEDVIEKERFILVSQIDCITLKHKHEIIPLESDIFTIKHSVNINGKDRKLANALALSMAAELPENMRRFALAVCGEAELKL